MAESVVEVIVGSALQGCGVPLATHFLGKERYAKSFFGNTLVEYLVQKFSIKARKQAVELAGLLFSIQVIHSAAPRASFLDGRLLYYFNESSVYYTGALKSLNGASKYNNNNVKSLEEVPVSAWLAYVNTIENPQGALAVCNLLLANGNKGKGTPLTPVYVKRAEVFMSLKDSHKASIDLKTAISLDPSYARSYLIEARMALLNNKLEEALKTISIVLELEPDNVEARAILDRLKGKPHSTQSHSAHSHKGLPLVLLTNSQTWNVPADVVRRSGPETKVATRDCREKFCTAARMDMDYVVTDISNTAAVLDEASQWIEQFYKEKNLPEADFVSRMQVVEGEVKATGTYWQTYDELSYACKVAWRNAPRCINRIQWNRMEIIDCRTAKTAEEIFDKCIEHLRFATNRGNVITTLTVFAPQQPGKPGPRIWNSQLIRYAGYKQQDGSIIGDPSNVELTEACQKFGWRSEGTMFDILPLIIQMPGEEAKLFPIPQEEVLVVEMQHPKYEWFGEMNLQWAAVPFVSNIGLTAGGVVYTCVPFNGWFMGTEISRNLGDLQRYNLLPKIAEKMGLDPTGPPSSLWQEKANVELNIAVLHSFQKARVSMVDHHTAASGFLNFWDAEHTAGRAVPADWVWLVPPCSGSVSPIFHLEMVNYLLKPAYYPLDFPGKDYTYPQDKTRHHSNISLKGLVKLVMMLLKFMKRAQDRRHRVTILFATETGNSERYAQRTAKFLSRTSMVRVINMEDYKMNELETEEVVLFVASTFGNGDPPSNGVDFKAKLEGLQLSAVRFSVLGLGTFGEFLDKRMDRLGATRITPLVKGDEIAGSELSYKTWIGALWTALSPLWGFTLGELTDGLKVLGLDHTEIKATFVPHFQLVSATATAPAPTSAPYSRNNPFTATLKENGELLTDVAGDRSTRRVVLEIGESNLKFNPGDHLGVLPTNRPELVDELLKLLKVREPDAVIRFEPKSDDSPLDHHLASRVFTLRQAFTELVDITTPPKPDLLEVLAQFAFHPGDKTQLQGLAKGAWAQHHLATVPQLLKLFPVSVPVEVLLERLPHQMPRFYSISSSLKVVPSEVHLTVSVVKYKTPSGDAHYGVASNFLARAAKGTPVKVFVRHSDFALPPSPSTPIILVGPGTGIAPFRSFWQERSKLQDLGPATLIFGCRSRKHDYIYQQEIEEAKAKGYISDVFVAFSRETEQKVYVQDLLLAQADKIWEALNRGAVFYVCGDVTMAKDVEDTMKEIGQKNGLGIRGATQFVEQLMKRKRYLTDVFGATLHVQKSITEQKDRVMTKIFKTSSRNLLKTSANLFIPLATCEEEEVEDTK